MSTFKDFRFRVEVDRHSTRRLTLTAAGKPPVAVATPPEFRGGLLNLWSPEDLLVASAATCYALTFEAVAERRELPLSGLDVTGVGHISRRADGRFGFVVIELAVTVTTDAGFEEHARRASQAAEQACIVSKALSVPVEVELKVRVRPLDVALVTA
jgi:organic hydroperoxide reductase OsmC/OhrA